MNIARVFRSLGELDELAASIGRSQKLGQTLSSGTTEMWGRQIAARIAEIREELNRNPAAKAARSAEQAAVVLGRS